MDHACDKFGSRNALEIAKRNVDKYYAVVGVLEMMEKSLEVLEEYIPFYFHGARRAYNRMPRVNRNKQKPPVTEELKKILKSNFSSELEFYDYCKQRLYKQYLAIK